MKELYACDDCIYCDETVSDNAISCHYYGHAVFKYKKCNRQKRIQIKKDSIVKENNREDLLSGLKTRAKNNNNYFGHHRFYEILDDLKELHSSKNRDYATQKDPLRNFKESGEVLKSIFKGGNEALKVMLVHMYKQVDAVKKLISEGRAGGVENISTRLKDVAVYAVLMMILFEETFEEHEHVIDDTVTDRFEQWCKDIGIREGYSKEELKVLIRELGGSIL